LGAARARISACIIAKNEADRIGPCLASVGFCDEVIVLDSGSTDGTQDVCRAAGAQVHEGDWPGYIEQKNRVLKLARHRWVLSVDADERVDDELRNAIEALRDGALGSPDGPRAYTVRRKTFTLGRWIKHGGWYPEWRTRLFDRTHSTWVGQNPHDKIQTDGTVARIEAGHLEHFTYRSIDDHIRQMNSFTRIMAEEMYRRGRRRTFFAILLRPTWHFFRMYVLRGGFLDGRAGYTLARLDAWYTFLKYTKLHEIVRRERAS
jgi:glycosyltransferase involved in cell wall biosynthesis